ncbi:MAG TPA: hypothetical protein VE084_12895, partial [Burkholderiaceae bacterium]|nr:hypothetical protein [Burkholderiaceae bacterium]
MPFPYPRRAWHRHARRACTLLLALASVGTVLAADPPGLLSPPPDPAVEAARSAAREAKAAAAASVQSARQAVAAADVEAGRLSQAMVEVIRKA